MASSGIRRLLVSLALGLPLLASSVRHSEPLPEEDLGALTQIASNESAEEVHPSNQLHAAATRSQTRACVRSRAQLFGDAYTWLGLAEPPVPEAKGQVDSESTLEELLLHLFDVEDKIARHEQHLRDYWRPIGWVKRYRSSSRAVLEAEQKALVAKLQLRGFSYSAATSRCGGKDTLFSSAHSLTDAVYTCMRQKLHESSTSGSGARDVAKEQVTQTKLMRRIVAEELLAHEQRWSVYRALQTIQKDATATLRKAGYSYDPLMKECKKLVGNGANDEELSKRTLEELDVGYTDENGTCQEVPGAMCPEGTAPDTRRRVDLAWGAAAASTAFVLTKSAMAVGFGLAGFITGGPAGAIAGLGLGFVSPVATPVSAAVGFWYSLGPNTCACFLRECEFDPAKGVCALQHGNSADSANPFGRALPYTGTKCGLKWKSNDTCELLDCTTMDYTWKSSASVNGAGIFGKFGTYEGDTSLYNCLSGTGRAEAAFSQLKTLPNGLKNTVEHRNVIFHIIGVPPQNDGPSKEGQKVPEEEEKPDIVLPEKEEGQKVPEQEEKPDIVPPEKEGQKVPEEGEKPDIVPPEKEGQKVPEEGEKPDIVPPEKEGQKVPEEGEKPDIVPPEKEGQKVPEEEEKPAIVPPEKEGQKVPEEEEKPDIAPPEKEGQKVPEEEEKPDIDAPEKEEAKAPTPSPTGGHGAAVEKDPPGLDPEIGLVADPEDVIPEDHSGVDPDIGLMADPEGVDDDIGLMAD